MNRVRALCPSSPQGLADVQELILQLQLPLELTKELDESVRSEYEWLWEASQHGSE